MYPSKTDGLFGVFVKNMRLEFENQGVDFSKLALIKGKSNSAFKKLLRYIKHYTRIFFLFYFRKSNYDLIYIHYITHHIPILLLLLPFKKKPWVINAHGDDIIGLMNNSKMDYFAKIILKKVDLLVVPSSYFKTVAKNHYSFLDDDAIYVSPSGGIDPERFYRKPNSTKNEILTLGFISRFIKEKGWETFLEVLLLLKKQKIAFRAIMAGKGLDEEHIKNYITKHNLQDEVDFKGFVKQEELVDLYNELDLYVFPTYRVSESLGLTGIEAMACATPVVACNIAGPSTYIKDGENGFLFPPKEAKSLKEKIMVYVNLPRSDKDKMQDKALFTAKTYGKNKVASDLKIRIQKLLKNK